ncbi:MAG TPA: membrane protein insertion efficiency factor YidD [Steroidobacteraceae bacterium]|nr:membrane protein insertion efficiency factor YidD [Steroidobacteraceae bacterium]
MVKPRQCFMWMIRAYQLAISPMFGPRCRFHPSCSCYAYTAIERYGILQGCWLGLRRLLRCHPFTDGGYDPVPDKRPTHA